MEEGEWDAVVTMFTGPQGAFEEPIESEASESNRMIGDFWIISDFSGNFGGMPFTGRGQFGYDQKKKKYVGTWIDSMNAHVTKMSGTWDAESKTMTYETIGMGMDGNPAKGKNVVVYESKDKRKMTMYSTMPGQEEMVKAMEIDYTRSK